MASEAEVPMTLDEALADVAARFLLNLPSNELPSVDRLFMQLQQAHWFYEDFYVDMYEHIEHLSGREFSRIMFHTCPLLERYKSQHADFYEQFKQYISSIPVYGTIMFTKGMKDMVLCKSFGGKSWNAARGKLNAGETPMECAARETLEESGYDPSKLIKADKYVEWSSGAQKVRLYVCVGVPKNFDYAPQTRKEIAEIRVWPTKEVLRKVKNKQGHQRFWHLFPAMGWLRAFVRSGGNIAAQTAKPGGRSSRGAGRSSGSSSKKAPGLHSKQVADLHNAETFDDLGDDDGWDVDGMFSAASQLTGIQFTYDGNNEQFGEGLTLTYDTDIVAARAAKEAGSAGAPPLTGADPAPAHPQPSGQDFLASLQSASQPANAAPAPHAQLHASQAHISDLHPAPLQQWPAVGHGHGAPPQHGQAALMHAFHPHGLHGQHHLQHAIQGSSGNLAASQSFAHPHSNTAPAGSMGMQGHRGTPPAIAAALAKSTPGVHGGGMPAGFVMQMSGGSLLSKLRMAQ